jgi:competence protein ComEC
MDQKVSRPERTCLVPDIRNIPFLRILIPFLLGIITCTVWKLNANVLIPLLLIFATITVLYFNNRSRFGVQQNTGLFILLCDLFLFFAAVQCCYQNNVLNDKNYYGHHLGSEKTLWSGEIIELPVEKENSCKILVEVKTFQNTSAVSGKTIIYIRKPFDKSQLKPGTLVTIRSAFHPVPEPLNPHEFNYREFLARKNIHYTCFVEAGEVIVNGASQEFSLVYLGSKIKQRILGAFNSTKLNKEAAQLCAALLTGYDDEISPETINAFAHSGTLHVLSVSGLHTGILYAVLIALLGWLDPHKKYKLLQLIIITVVLWTFVLITGFSPPVLRAGIMLNLIAVGRFYYSYASYHSLNILPVSAFIILVFDPLLIMDAGFLLSYSAVAGILLFEPAITSLVDSRFGIINKMWQLTSVSLSAQISTLPITLFLFHQFPLWFVFTNLIVIPLCIIVMALGFLFLIKMSFLASLINACSACIFYVIHLTDMPGSGYVDHIDFGWTDLLLLSFFIIATALFIKHRSYVHAIAAFSFLILWQLSSIIEVSVKRNDAHIAVYQVRKQSVVDLKNSAELYFRNEASSNNYNYHIRNNHTYLNCEDQGALSFDYVVSSKAKFLSLSTSGQQWLLKFLKPDHILVKHNLELSEDLLKDVKPKLIIADGSNNYSGIKKLKALCDKFAIPFHSTAKDGYLQIEL